MEVEGQRVGVRLRLVVVLHARQVLPAPVAPHLDQPRSELNREAPRAQRARRELVGARTRQQGQSIQHSKQRVEMIVLLSGLTALLL